MVSKPSAGKCPLRILLVEDSRSDVDLCLHELKKSGFEASADVVNTPEAFAERLGANSYDVVLADYKLPQWTGMDALECLKRQGKDIPFILVTGTLGEETAVECIRKGAADYVLKDRLPRLPFAIRRALEEKTLREQRKQLEEQLRQAQKMEAVGRLAGGIAHDFNNVLMVIKGYSELLSDKLKGNDRLRAMTGEIQQAADRATGLVRQLLAFSRKQVLCPQVLSLNTVVTNIERMLQRLIGEDIELATALSPSLGCVKADPGQLEQVIVNLAVNARDAMPQGGKLTIETADVDLDEDYAQQKLGARPGPYVLLAVTDTGQGMDKETQARIFEPFFSTKEKNKGTGLGLATVYGIVKQSGGYIWVYSEPGQGTTFKVYLPRAAEAEEPVVLPEPVARMLTPRQENRTALLVEDEATLRALECQYLEANGFKVLEAESGAEAIQVAAEHKGPISLLMTDVVMPGMSGRALAEQIAARRPGIKVLYVSGYPDQTIARHGVLESNMHFLQKPFSAESLKRKLKELFGP